MESDTRTIRVFIPSINNIRTVRRVDFHPTTEDNLPLISSMIDGISLQTSIEVEEQTQDGCAEDQFSHCLSSMFIPHKSHLGNSDGPPLPK